MDRAPSSLEPILSQNIGYTILLGVGLVMAVAVTLLVRIETKWLGTKKTSEWFYTAGRILMTGFIASPVVSAWTGLLHPFNLPRLHINLGKCTRGASIHKNVGF